MEFLKKITSAVSKIGDPGTDVHAAATKGDVKHVKKIIAAHPMTVDSQNSDGDTALHIAAMYNKTEIAQALLKAGANPNIANNKEATPLHKAAFMGSFDVAKLLLEHHADFRRSCKGVTPLEMAKQARRPAIVELIQEKMGKQK